MESTMDLEADGARASFDLERGGRLASLCVDGIELLVDAESDPMRWGSYPMAPWAGRIRHGRFTFGGRTHNMPITLGPHAIHGTAYEAAWDRTADDAMALRLTEPWPYAGVLTQSATLTGSMLRVTMQLHAEETQPAMLGWHPWFRRRLDGLGNDAELQLAIKPGAMYELDDEMIPTGRLVPPSPPPWDNCFVDMAEAPRLTWPGFLDLTVQSDCRCWTVFTEPEHAMCVEPQTDAPDAFNRDPVVVEAGAVLSATMELRWKSLGN